MRNLSKRNIIILSSIDWDSHRQLHHELIDYLSKKIIKYYSLKTLAQEMLNNRFSKNKKRLYNFVRSSKGFKKINKNITLFSPIFFPYYFNFFLKYKFIIVLKSIFKWSNNDFDNPIIINFITNPITYSVINNINSNLVIYYMAE